MSIQERQFHHDFPEQPSSLSSVVINRGSEAYDPFSTDDDDHETNQSKKTQKPESIQIKNGVTVNPVIINTSGSSSLNQSLSIQTDEQRQSQCKNESSTEQNNNHSDNRSKSSSYRNHNSSDRKRLHSSSPDPSNRTTVNNKESSNSEQTSSRHKKSYRNDERKKTKHYHRHRSSSSKSSSSRSPSSPTTPNHSNRLINRSEKRYDDGNSHRRDSARNYHSHSSSKYPSRDNTSSASNDRRTNFSSPPSLQSKIVVSDGNSSSSNVEPNNHESSTEDRKRIYNRLKTMNDTNQPVVPQNNTNKVPCAIPPFVNTNGGTQRTRSNLIQIVTTEAASILSSSPSSTQVPPNRSSSSQVKPQSHNSSLPPSLNAKFTSTKNAKDSTQSTVSSKTNGNTANDILMEEMLFGDQDQLPVKTLDLDSLTIPDSSNKKSTDKVEPSKTDCTTTTAAAATTTLTTITTATTTTTVTTTLMTPTTTTTTTVATAVSSSQTKKPYTLYKVQHVNHMTPHLTSRYKKQPPKESITTQSDSTTNKPSTDDGVRRPSLDERLLNVFGTSSTSPTKPTNPVTEQQNGTRSNPPTQTTTPSDKNQDYLSLVKRLNTNDERRSQTSKDYTSEWLASQKPEEAPAEELAAPPSPTTVPSSVTTQSSVVSTQPSTSSAGQEAMFGKLTEAISKLIQKRPDTNGPAITTTEPDDAVPTSAKHLERLQRRKEREERQSKIATIAKEVLKPAFKKHDINKDEYKEIMKKVVTKATHANEVDRVRISNMVTAYIEKYRTIHQHNASKTTSNGNGAKSR